MSVLQRLWKDRMDIYRYEEYEEDGFTKMRKEKIYENVKCHYSKGRLVDIGEEVPTLVNSHTLFCGSDVDLQEGDRVVVTQRNGKQISLSVGEGFSYSTHQEFSVKRDDKV